MANKIIYIANINISTERAHGIQITKTCEALARAGAQVELWVSGRKSSFGSANKNFTAKFLPSFNFLPKSWKINFYLKSLSFFISALFFLGREKSGAVIYTRDEIILFLCFLTRRKIFWESHMTLWFDFLDKARIKGLRGIIAISENLRRIIIDKYGIASKKIIVAHDAVDLDEFGKLETKTEARKALKIETNKKIAVYTGSILKRKGIFTILEAAALLGYNYIFLIIGGGIGDEKKKAEAFVLKKGIKNVIFNGYVGHKEIARYLAIADVLILPNSALDQRTRDFTSPLKLFEYMASGRPIVASATPTIKEVLNENNAVLVEPDSPESMKEGLLKIFSDQKLAEELAQRARKDVENYTWDKRAEKILDFIK
jgi:glycosyltransferase involved in cell wall biosynthesis